MTKLSWTDPETGSEEELDLEGWRFQVTMGDKVLHDVPLVVQFLKSNIDLLTEYPEAHPLRLWGGKIGEAPLAVVYSDGVPCIAQFVKAAI